MVALPFPFTEFASLEADELSGAADILQAQKYGGVKESIVKVLFAVGTTRRSGRITPRALFPAKRLSFCRFASFP